MKAEACLDNYDNPAFTVIYTAEHDPNSDRTMVESAYLNLKEYFLILRMTYEYTNARWCV